MSLQQALFFRSYKEVPIREANLNIFTQVELKKIPLDKVIRVQDNSTIVTLANWEKLKDTFKRQRLENYSTLLTAAETVALEVAHVKSLKAQSSANHPFNILSDRYLVQLQSKHEDDRLGFRYIALIHAYRNDFKSEKAQEIAAAYGWTAKGSGKKLTDRHGEVCTSRRRMADEGTKTTTRNKKNRIESILEYLTKEQRNKALVEIKSLEKAIEVYP